MRTDEQCCSLARKVARNQPAVLSSDPCLSEVNPAWEHFCCGENVTFLAQRISLLASQVSVSICCTSVRIAEELDRRLRQVFGTQYVSFLRPRLGCAGRKWLDRGYTLAATTCPICGLAPPATFVAQHVPNEIGACAFVVREGARACRRQPAAYLRGTLVRPELCVSTKPRRTAIGERNVQTARGTR